MASPFGINSRIGPADFSRPSARATDRGGDVSGSSLESELFTTPSGKTVDLGEFEFTQREPTKQESAANEKAENAESFRSAAQLRGPELGRRSVQSMVETRNMMDRTKDILSSPPEGIPNTSRPRTGLGTAIEEAANPFAINSVNLTADQMARNQLSQQAQHAGLPQDQADAYANSVVNDAKTIRNTDPNLSPQQVAERAISRNGAAFGDPAVDAAQNDPGIGLGKPVGSGVHRPEFKPDFTQKNPTVGPHIDDALNQEELTQFEPETRPVEEDKIGPAFGTADHFDIPGKPPGAGGWLGIGIQDPFEGLPTAADVGQALDTAGKNIASGWNTVSDFARGAWAGVKQGISWVGDKISQNAQIDRPSILETRDAQMGISSISAKDAFNGATSALGSVGKSISDVASNVGSSISDVASSVGSSLSDAASSVGSSLSDAASSISETVSNIGSSISESLGFGGDESDNGNGGSDSGQGESRVICTHFYHKGELSRNDWAADLRFTKENLSEQTMRGYHLWAVPTVRLMRSESLAGQIVEPVMRFIAIHRAQELAYQMGKRVAGDVMGKAIRHTIEPLCWTLGAFVGEQNWRSLYATPRST